MSAFQTSSQVIPTLLVGGPPKALRGKDKTPWLLCRKSEHLRMGRPEQVSRRNSLQSTSKGGWDLERYRWQERGGN